MKKLSIIIFVLYVGLGANAQIVKKISEESIDAGERNVAQLFSGKITSNIKIVGIGDVAFFSHEPAKFNTALMAYLIKEKDFKFISLLIDDWRIRPLNNYLLDKKTSNRQIADSLLEIAFARSPYYTAEFEDFAIWLKDYNMKHEKQPVTFVGSGVSDPIPNSYFLSKYILPLDKESGLLLSQKWATYNYPDSSAFNDIQNWYNKITTGSNNPQQNQLLLSLCNEDIQHNNDIKKMPLLLAQPTPQEYYTFIMNHYTDKIMSKDNKKSILYSLNFLIAKANIISYKNVLIPSAGLLLHNRFGNRYFVCLTDFADTAIHTIANAAHKEFNKDTVVSSTLQVHDIYNKNGDHIFISDNSILLNDYVPKSLPFSKGQTTPTIPDKNVIPQDALFIFKNLTPATYLGK
jgi:hypothetical protein